MKKRFTILIAAAVMLLTMMASTGTMWGQSRTETTTTYTFTSASWTATSGGSAANWTSGHNGAGFNNNGIQVTTNSTGANGTSPVSFTNVTKVVATYNTNKSAGAGSIVAQIGSNTATTNSVAYPGSGDGRTGYYTTEFDYTTAQTGNVKITVNTTTNSIYLVSVAITTNDGTTPSISASNVEIAYDDEEGSIAYTLNNATGNVTAEVTSGDWLELGTITATEVPFTCLPNEGAAARTATVTLSFTGANNKIVTITQAGNPNAPGTQNNPYTVAQARAAIDAGTGVNGVYATGIVSAIPTAWSTQHNNITFNIVDESGDEDFLQAFRCVSTTSADASTVAVGDIVVVYGNLLLYQSTTYEFAQGCQLISLEHPSTPYFTANDVNITYDATGGNIAYTVENPVQGGQVTATTTSTWLTLSNNFASPIAFTCDANEAGERTATVTLTYTYGAKATVNKEVTITQAGNPNVFDNIEDITEVGTSYSIKGTVVANNSKGFIMGDGTGYAYTYLNAAPTVEVGDMVTVSGTTGSYGHIIQFTSTATIAEATSSNYDGTPEVTVITAVPDYSEGYHMATYLQFEGELTKSGSNYLVAVGDSQIRISYPTTEQATALATLENKTVRVHGFFSGISGSGTSAVFTATMESIEEVVITTPSITVSPASVNAPVDGADGTLTVTYENITDIAADVWFCNAAGTEDATYGWITAEINNSTNNVDYLIEQNNGEARTAYFKVWAYDDGMDEVYSNLVTVTQAAYVAPTPSIAVDPTLVEAPAAGADGTITVTLTAIENNDIEIHWFESDGTTAATYNHDWIEATVDPNNDIDYIIEENTGDARSAYFKVYGLDGETNDVYSELITINQAAYVVDYATLPFEWDDTSTPTGITNYGVGTYSSSPYLKFDNTGDYIILKINERPGSLSFDIKGNSFSGGTFKVQTSENGETYTDLKTYTTLGDIQNESFDALGENVRYIKWIYTEKSNGNVALGNIALAAYDNSPSISADDIAVEYNATSGNIMYTINNYVAGTMVATTEADWISEFTYNQMDEIGEVGFTTTANTGAERSATVTLTYTYNNSKATATKDVTVTQDGAPVVMYTVNFLLDGGTFVPNDDFTDEIVEIAAGTYNLPSATKAGYDFTGWNDGDQTYAAGDEYTVSADVDFTAQWTESTTGTIVFGTNNVKINATEVSGDDSMGNTWTITTEGTSSFTQNAAYSQVGSGSSPATSITFSMTLPQQKIISAFEAKFGGFNGTVGDIALTVGNTTVGSGSLNGSTDVIVEATTTTEVGTVLTVTVTNIDKGVKCYYISYTLSDAPVVPVINPTANPIAYNATTGSIDYTIDNYEEGTMTAATEATWISNIAVEAVDEIGEVTFNVTNNTSNESRTATVTLTFTYGDPAVTVTKDVTVTQNGTPSITVTPATANVAFAGGAPDFAVTYESLDIDNASDFDVAFYETSTSTTSITKPEWITSAVISGNTTDGFTLTTTVAANDGAARNAYLKVYALDENTEPVYSGLVTISQAEHTQLATYSLVTSVDDIVSGKHYIIASSATDGDAYAMGGQTSNNRSGVAVIIDNSQITETEDVYEFVINTHKTSSKDVVYTIYDAATPGYLYAASSSKNYLRTKTTLDDNGKWTIAIAAEGSAASIVAQGSNTRNNMKFNSSDGIFSCYASGQSAIYLYVKVNDTDLEYYGTEINYAQDEIPAGETITVGTGSVMTITSNSFTNNDPDNLIIEDGGQIIHDNAGVKATVKKSITGYGTGTGNYYLLVTPFTENIDPASVTNMIAATPTDYDLYQWNSGEAEEWRNYKQGTFTLNNGIGYLYANKNNVELTFTGTLKQSNEVVTVNPDYITADFGDWTLVGNPFPCDAYIIDANSSMAFYRMKSTGDGFETATGAIKPMEGIFVQTSEESQSFKFTREAPVTSPGKGNLNINVAQVVNSRDAQPVADNAIIRFDGGNNLKKFSFREDNTKVYIPQNGKDYAVVNAQAQGEMPVNFKAAENGTYTIDFSMDNVEFSYLHLIDNKTGMDIDLLQNSSYTFEASKIDYASRFKLVFSTNNNSNSNDDNDFAFFDANGNLLILGNEGTATLQVIDITGRTVSNETFSGNYSKAINAKAGVYMLRLIQGNDVRTQKIVVR
ncbi:MAG: T9SS type A sorting domain-containing protein [Bacteroidales bacterium]|nr:T9SS type A sorting domain-containing protein [Bacteroidales bacterium]